MRPLLLFAILAALVGCAQNHQNAKSTSAKPTISPNYTQTTIPPNIAPINFKIDGAIKCVAEFSLNGQLKLTVKGNNAIQIPPKPWKTLLQQAQGQTLDVTLFAKQGDQWFKYQSFTLHVAPEPIDTHIAYRLIEPGYELWNKMGIYQRDLTNFEERVIFHNQLTEKNCINCHSFDNYSPDKFMFHVRGEGGATIFVDQDHIEKINLKRDGLISAGVYPKWHPSGKYIAYSTNETHQSFHAHGTKKIEVYDLASDLIVYDVENNKVIVDQRVMLPDQFETFPTWSPDGEYLYFCRAPHCVMPREYKSLRYALCRIRFDQERGQLVDSVERVEGVVEGRSMLFPRISPDGRYLLYTSASSGTFPIWYKDADLAMVDLANGQDVDISIVNSDQADSYHSWSSNGRWVVFSSRRDDGLYTRPYIAYFGADGTFSKPFILPQKDVAYYTLLNKSYNIPEFVNGWVRTSPKAIERVLYNKNTKNAK